jgi:hypothetical protein
MAYTVSAEGSNLERLTFIESKCSEVQIEFYEVQNCYSTGYETY